MNLTAILLAVGIAALVYVAAGIWFVNRQMKGTQFIHESGAILRVEGRPVTDSDMPVLSRCLEMFTEDPGSPEILAALEQAGFEARYVSRGRS